MVLLRDALWTVDLYAADPFLAAWSFSWALTREVIAALEHRIEQLQASHHAAEFRVDTLRANPGTPAHVVEHVRYTQARLDGEAQWTRELLARLHAGDYQFADETPPLSEHHDTAPHGPDGQPHGEVTSARPSR